MQTTKGKTKKEIKTELIVLFVNSLPKKNNSFFVINRFNSGWTSLRRSIHRSLIN